MAVAIVSIKFETNLKMYIEIARDLLQNISVRKLVYSMNDHFKQKCTHICIKYLVICIHIFRLILSLVDSLY